MSGDPELNVRPASNADCEEVRGLVFGILAEYGLKPEIDGIDRDLFDIEASYIDRGGVFEVFVDGNGAIQGSVGLFPIDSETIELRKMYFTPSIRGKGLGKKTLTRMIETARAKGYRKLTLETASVLVEAIGLYKSFGFLPVEDSHAPRCDRSFELML